VALNDRLVVRIALAGLLAGSLALSACGRKGALEVPPRAGITGEPAAASDGDKTPARPDRPFILDPLI
jgi:predicted small lipoprotein YifL